MLMGESASAIPDLSDCIFGDSYDPRGMIFDARSFKRATAIGRFAMEFGVDFGSVKCRTIHARWLTKDEQWECDMDVWWDNWLDENWDEDTQGEPPDPPDDPPTDYEADWETTPAWTPCKKGDDGAVKVYACEVAS